MAACSPPVMQMPVVRICRGCNAQAPMAFEPATNLAPIDAMGFVTLETGTVAVRMRSADPACFKCAPPEQGPPQSFVVNALVARIVSLEAEVEKYRQRVAALERALAEPAAEPVAEVGAEAGAIPLKLPSPAEAKHLFGNQRRHAEHPGRQTQLGDPQHMVGGRKVWLCAECRLEWHGVHASLCYSCTQHAVEIAKDVQRNASPVEYTHCTICDSGRSHHVTLMGCVTCRPVRSPDGAECVRRTCNGCQTVEIPGHLRWCARCITAEPWKQ
jgi:hypothetical protein